MEDWGAIWILEVDPQIPSVGWVEDSPGYPCNQDWGLAGILSRFLGSLNLGNLFLRERECSLFLGSILVSLFAFMERFVPGGPTCA